MNTNNPFDGLSQDQLFGKFFGSKQLVNGFDLFYTKMSATPRDALITAFSRTGFTVSYRKNVGAYKVIITAMLPVPTLYDPLELLEELRQKFGSFGDYDGSELYIDTDYLNRSTQ